LAGKFNPEKPRESRKFIKVHEGVETFKQGFYVGASFSITIGGDLLFINNDVIKEDEIVWLDNQGKEIRPPFKTNGWITGITLTSNTNLIAGIHSAFGTAPNLWLFDLKTNDRKKISSGNVLDTSPRFLQNKNQVAFVSPRNWNNWDLYITSIDGSGDSSMILNRPGDIQDPHFSRDERKVLFTERDVKGKLDVFVQQFDENTESIPIATTAADESMARFSPDEKYIVYRSNETGRDEVYVVPFPNDNNLRWQISTEGGNLPIWSIDGKKIYYQSGDDLMSVNVNSVNSFTYGAPKKMFELKDLSWTRNITSDGQSFVMIRSDLRAPGQVILIKNWMQEVQKKLEENN
jgi:serine/threonine-protein kinase